MRIKGFPRRFGLRSENAANRIAVEHDTADGPRTGVYIPRRDSASVVNRLVGGRFFPGEHHPATFHVQDSAPELCVAFAARDGSTRVDVRVRVADRLGESALFADLAAASAFFERGAPGWSATRDTGRFDGLELQTRAWRVEPVEILRATSSFFDDPIAFPPGSTVLDCALVMRRVPVTWAARGELWTGTPVR